MSYPTVIPAFDFRDMVATVDNRVITTSLKVAEYFGKRHKDVLRAIRNLKCSDDFTRRNFAPVDFIDKNGDLQPMFNITRDGCMMLVMGFTGQAATAIKECYINAFNWMAEQLSRRQMMGEKAMHNLAMKEARSKLRASIGSRFLNDRKKEIPLLLAEEKRIRAICEPELFEGMLP